MAVNDYLSIVIGCRIFQIELGYRIPSAELFIDNISTGHLIQNGTSNSKNTKHIHIKVCFELHSK